MRLLIILDPLSQLDLSWDSSLYLVREMAARGHEIWAADVPDLTFDSAHASRLQTGFGQKFSPDFTQEEANQYFQALAQVPVNVVQNKRLSYSYFDRILIRKEPPVDAAYIEMTHKLEKAAREIPSQNHPAGIRRTNEKLSILNFPGMIPESLVSASIDEIIRFQKQLGTQLVIKPLNERGGKGVFILPSSSTEARNALNAATSGGQVSIMAQRYLASLFDKRIILLNGNILGAFERHAPANDFRTNLVLGGSSRVTTLSPEEIALVERMRPYLLSQGLTLVGIDVMENKLLEINVTCPSGISDLKMLEPQLRPVEDWADFLERIPSIPVLPSP